MGQKPRLHCSDKCRYEYWRSNLDEEKRQGFSEKKCAACGEAFYSYDGNKRKYCCHEHYVAARYGREIQQRMTKPQMIAPPLSGVIKEEARGDIFEEIYRPMPAGAEDQIRILPIRVADEDEELNPRRVFLMPGPSKFQGKYDHFVGLIPLSAEDRVFSGDVFVFCNIQRTQLSVLQWQDDGFALFFKRTEFERYPWPFAVEQELIEITPSDLHFLLEIPRFMRRLYGITLR